MLPYPPAVEATMRALFDSLSERDRRRYAAVEADKLGHGGLAYISRLLRLDPKTIRRGRHDLRRPDPPPSGRCRKKGAVANER